MEKVCFLIKPDATRRNLERDILADIENSFPIVATRKLTLTKEVASKFYMEHFGKPFYNELVDYMTSGEIIAVAAAVPSVAEARALVGATDLTKAEVGTLRKKYALSKSENSVHCSDSTDAATYELGLIFNVPDKVILFPVRTEEKVGSLSPIEVRATIEEGDKTRTILLETCEREDYEALIDIYSVQLLYKKLEVIPLACD
jgi:nucleoside-diphosphate kinase